MENGRLAFVVSIIFVKNVILKTFKVKRIFFSLNGSEKSLVLLCRKESVSVFCEVEEKSEVRGGKPRVCSRTDHLQLA